MSVDFTTSVNGIWKQPDVQGGNACIRNHRIPVWILVNLKRHGAIDAEILQDYTSLTLPDLAAAWKYYDCCPEEIDRAIRENGEW